MENQQQPKTGILEEGKETLYVDVDTEGFNIGLHNKGEKTNIIGGKHKTNSTNIKRWWEKTWIQLIMFISAILGIIGFIYLFLNS